MWKGSFASIIKLRCSRCGDHAEFGPDPKSNSRDPYKREKQEALGAQRQMGEALKTEAETGVVLPPNKRHLRIIKKPEETYPDPSGEYSPADTLIQISNLQNCERINVCCLSHHFVVLCYGKTRKLICRLWFILFHFKY